MSDPVDAIASAAARAVDAHAEGWLDRGLERARDLVADRSSAVGEQLRDGSLDPRTGLEHAMLGQALVGLDAIGARRPALLLLGHDVTQRVLVQVAVGREAEARLLALASTATYQERRAASGLSTSATVAATEARARATEEAIALAKDVGLGALRAALPFLLAAL